ncbi:MAG: hypothetical protein HY265_06425, partial [Deltaproteobacteria bacterium]|nr:hypothetical protein [Deltaproteobacteria bacterium]
ILTVLLAFAFGLGLMLLAAAPSMALHKNYDGNLACGGCHTMHNSQGGDVSMGGSPSIVLLRGALTSRQTMHNFCLQCHASNGAQASNTFETDAHPAPKVYINGKLGAGNSSVAGTLDDFASIGAGGDFSGDLSGNSLGWTDGSTNFLGKAHSLGAGNITPPGGDAAVGTNGFSCTNCHDPHGAYTTSTSTVNKFRNLKVAAAGAILNAMSVNLNAGIAGWIGEAGLVFKPGTNSTKNGCATASTCVWPMYNDNGGVAFTGTTTTDSNRSNSYGVDGATATGTNGIGNWCSQCHDKWHESNTYTAAGGGTNNYVALAAGSDWKRHPVDTVLSGAGAMTTSGSGVTIIDTTNYNAAIATFKALPVATTTGSGVAYMASGQQANNKVFCLSCHFAHGGPYYDNLRWSYVSGVSSGDQTALGLASNVGCQLCHNR